jgi:hypothetical protein
LETTFRGNLGNVLALEDLRLACTDPGNSVEAAVLEYRGKD